MAELSIQITGIPQLIAKLGAAVAARTLERAMTRAEARVKATLQKYPPPPSGSSYVRTGDLGRSWTSEAPSFSGGVLVGSVENAVRGRRSGRPYAKWVQSAEDQAWMHQDRWTTDQQALDQNRSAIEADFSGAIQSALNT